MIFTARPDEQVVINMIHEIRGGDYILVRMTPTMIEKNNIDANGGFREMLENANIVDYEVLLHGGQYGVSEEAIFIQKNAITPVKLKFYRVNNDRGDRRFSVETIKRKMKNKEINEGDLLYISIYKDAANKQKIFIINLTSYHINTTRMTWYSVYIFHNITSFYILIKM